MFSYGIIFIIVYGYFVLLKSSSIPIDLGLSSNIIFFLVSLALKALLRSIESNARV